VTPQIIGQSEPAPDADALPEGNMPPADARDVPPGDAPAPVEIGGRKGPEPTRYGDWEKNGRCIDF